MFNIVCFLQKTEINLTTFPLRVLIIPPFLSPGYLGIECVNATCVGINAKANILLATVEVLEPLFQNPPHQISGRVDLLLRKLNNYQMNAIDLKQSLVDLTGAYTL